MQLIYRGYSCAHTPRAIQPYCKPRALNWRYQISGETYEAFSRPISAYCCPRAVNWRYQTSNH